MDKPLEIIPLTHLVFAALPAAVVVIILFRWSLSWKTALYALARMLIQLMAIGYFLMFIFNSESSLVVAGVLTVMLLVAGWISMRPVRASGNAHYGKALGAIVFGGVTTLLLVTQAVLRVDPWFRPDAVIPLAGMIFSTSMNTVSLSAERFVAETALGKSAKEARPVALNAALIPHTNMLFAVGLVSLPGMMTGQILSGIDPLVAARYQIMVMCMMFGAAGISTACYLAMQREK